MASSSSPVAHPNTARSLRGGGGGVGTVASMEFCYACHISPLSSRLGFFRNPKFRLPRRCLPSYSWQWTKLQNRVKVSLHPGIVSQMPQRDGDPIITCKGLCKVLWSIEADIADGYIIFLTGDPVTLGCWEPRMAILLSPCKGRANTWAVEMKVPCGIHFKYNYFIRDQNKPSTDPIWRPGPEFSLSIPSIDLENEVIFVRDSWIRNFARGPPIPSWGSWMMDKEPSVKQLKGRDQLPSSGELDILQGLNGVPLQANHLSSNGMPEGDSKSVGKHIKINFNPEDKVSERDQPVEEPWLLRSTLLTLADISEVDIVADHDEEQGKEYLRKLHETEKQALENEHKVARLEEPASTVILINASVCTMQRIAVLEDDKLVELLLEPVKNNVQCDSIYLGVVTKLVPHMGGAFVDIGISRPSLMDIKQNREPFIYPPFKHEVEGGLNNESPNLWPKEYFNTDEQDCNFEEEDAADELVEGENQDDSLQIMDQETIEHEPADEIVDPDSPTMISSSDAIELDDIVTDSRVNGERDDNLEDDYTEDFLPLESGSSENSDLPLLIKQSLRDSDDTSSNRNKWTHVREGTKVIVQVVKEGLGTKGPALTAHPNLRSRFWILITRCNRVGVSKKITGAERTRLKVIAKELQPPGFGLTVRTVAAGHSLEELKKDLDGLLSTWKGIVEHAKSAALAADEGIEGAVPVILHRAMGQTLSVVQDYFNEKVKSMVVDSPRTYHEVTSYLQEIAPDLCNRVILYEKRTPIFDEYNIEEEIDTILSKRISLSNGGYLVIEQTEALVSIDVNGGQCVLGEGTSQEKAVLEVNLAAAKQIARELRLRDIGGIIVVDFIDMADESNRRLVYEEMKKAVERDRSTVRVSELSKLGLMEITRKRVRPSVTFMISEPCTCCHATGRVEALETSFSKIEHEICRLLAVSDEKPEAENAKSWPRFVLKVDRFMCNYLTSGKKTKLAVLSSSLKVWILLKVARGLSRGSFEVKPFGNDKAKDDQEVAISRLRPTAGRTYIPSTKLTLFPVKKWKSRGK